mmetsp:Transcript_28979/g.80924  ORF Transcript_28979/g.80924 Transcript_28979/m.80924 type:complete len:215 (+) Transcript_28979:376-1020(+)
MLPSTLAALVMASMSPPKNHPAAAPGGSVGLATLDTAAANPTAGFVSLAALSAPPVASAAPPAPPAAPASASFAAGSAAGSSAGTPPKNHAASSASASSICFSSTSRVMLSLYSTWSSFRAMIAADVARPSANTASKSSIGPLRRARTPKSFPNARSLPHRLRAPAPPVSAPPGAVPRPASVASIRFELRREVECRPRERAVCNPLCMLCRLLR